MTNHLGLEPLTKAVPILHNYSQAPFVVLNKLLTASSISAGCDWSCADVGDCGSCFADLSMDLVPIILSVGGFGSCFADWSVDLVAIILSVGGCDSCFADLSIDLVSISSMAGPLTAVFSAGSNG